MRGDLTSLNISHNEMELKSALSISHGLRHTITLKEVDVSGNPIGQFGMRLFMQAMSQNTNVDFKVNMKSISAEQERKLDKKIGDSALNFDPQNPEGKFVLDLSQAYNQICLQKLLESAEKACAENEGAFEVKACFAGVTFNGKSKWDPPMEKDSLGIYNLGEAPSGILKF